jgi:hypothetical protein
MKRYQNFLLGPDFIISLFGLVKGVGGVPKFDFADSDFKLGTFMA